MARDAVPARPALTQPELAAGRGPEAPERVPGQPRRFARFESVAIGTFTVVAFLAAWQLIAQARIVPELFMPAPTEVALAFRNMFGDEDIWVDLGTSGTELAIGFVLAIAVGLPLGLVMGWYRRFSYALDPFMSFFYSTPRVALIPLLIIWLGIGIWSKIAVIYLGAFFPIVINTMAGIRSLDSGLLKAARSFGASDAQIFRTIALPGSVPFILTGLRLGVGHALTGVVVGELIAAQHGIGLRMSIAGTTFQTAKVFAALILIAGTGVLLTLVLLRLERRFDAWRPRTGK